MDLLLGQLAVRRHLHGHGVDVGDGDRPTVRVVVVRLRLARLAKLVRARRVLQRRDQRLALRLAVQVERRRVEPLEEELLVALTERSGECGQELLDGFRAEPAAGRLGSRSGFAAAVAARRWCSVSSDNRRPWGAPRAEATGASSASVRLNERAFSWRPCVPRASSPENSPYPSSAPPTARSATRWVERLIASRQPATKAVAGRCRRRSTEALAATAETAARLPSGPRPDTMAACELPQS